MSLKITKLPRLYIDQALAESDSITLEAGPAHYLKTVLRRQVGDCFRVFNGQDGEFLAEISEIGKRSGCGVLVKKLKNQPACACSVHLFFAPIKKQRMDFLIEKAVELGVTDLHPVITARCETRKINTKRLGANIIEAAEQCERLDMPHLHDPQKLEKIIVGWGQDISIYTCIERIETQAIQDVISSGDVAFLVGPEGGFDDREIEFLSVQEKITIVSLGSEILRSETAALTCLALAKFK